jgi:hypothetical protein
MELWRLSATDLDNRTSEPAPSLADSLDYQIQTRLEWGLSNLKPEDMCNPTGVQLLLEKQKELLIEAKESRREIERLREENKTLREDLQKLGEQAKWFPFEIMGDCLIGWGTNLLTSIGSENSNLLFGLLLLVGGLALRLALWIANFVDIRPRM